MKKFIFLFLLVIFFLNVSPVSAISPTPPPPPPLNWQPCQESPTRDCATLTVPIDYNDLSKGNMELRVGRARATGTSIGPLIYQPGGPGVWPLNVVLFRNLTNIFGPEIVQKFDIIGLAPRGTTEGILCFTSQSQGEYWETNHFPQTPTELNHLLSLEQQANQNCINNNEPLARSVASENSIRDYEQLRLAMSVEKLNFFGLSYGSYFGNRYAVLFPGRTRAMVMDAVTDRSRSDTITFIEDTRVYDDAWQEFKIWCQNQPTCRFQNKNLDEVLVGLLFK